MYLPGRRHFEVWKGVVLLVVLEGVFGHPGTGCFCCMGLVLLLLSVHGAFIQKQQNRSGTQH
jgi:hypothetical protein